MDDDGWNRSLYVAWTVKIWQISDYKFERITTYSPIHITRDLFKDPNPRNYFCYRLFQMERNCDELQLIACDVKWTVIFRPWVSYLVQSILVQTSQISHFIISFFFDTKNQFYFSVWMWQVLFGKLMNHFRRVNKCKWVIIRIDLRTEFRLRIYRDCTEIQSRKR